MLGLLTLRFFNELMPLLLRWCHGPDLGTQLKAMQALQEVVRHTWPRMPAHASFLWSQLQRISADTANRAKEEEYMPGADDVSYAYAAVSPKQIQDCIASIARMLYLCGGVPFQKSVQDALHSSHIVNTDIMLQAVASQSCKSQQAGCNI